MATYDLESFLADVETLIKADLNTRLAAIDAEKNDGITTDTVNASAYFLQSLNDREIPYDPFVFYGIEDVEGEAIGPATLEISKVRIFLVKADNGQDVNLMKKLFRYRRALKEVFHNKFDRVRPGLKVRISSPKIRVNDSDEFKSIEMLLEASIA